MIVREPEQQFIQAPAGVHGAVCVDEVDMGLLPNRFDPESGPVQTVRIFWQIDEVMTDGRPYLIKKDYRASLHEKAGLRKDLEAWRGRPFTFDELAGFDLEAVVGAPCMINIVKKLSRKGKEFSNIASITPLPKGMNRIEPRGYVRVKDRPQPTAARNSEPEHQPFADVNDDDVPF